MKIIDPSYEIIFPNLKSPESIETVYKYIEDAARTCYASEPAAMEGTAEKKVRDLISSNHGAMLEHASMCVVFTTSRGVSHELVRHRLAAFAQESQRYCNYSKEKFGHDVTFIRPGFLKHAPIDATAEWIEAMKAAEASYFKLLDIGCTPQEARGVLPNDTKTKIRITANMREWRHIMNLRAAGTTGKPHPEVIRLMVPLLTELREKMPALFGDIVPLTVDA